jgi:hypothetical protein
MVMHYIPSEGFLGTVRDGWTCFGQSIFAKAQMRKVYLKHLQPSLTVPKSPPQ